MTCVLLYSLALVPGDLNAGDPHLRLPWSTSGAEILASDRVEISRTDISVDGWVVALLADSGRVARLDRALKREGERDPNFHVLMYDDGEAMWQAERPRLLLLADEDTPYGVVDEVLQAAHRAGRTDVRLGVRHVPEDGGDVGPGL